MYLVDIINGEFTTRIHGKKEKLKSGSVVKGINSIDSFSFTILPTNKGFNRINDYKTLVRVYNTNRNRYEFFGRVLYSNTTMDTSGLITKEVTCESYFGFFQDSIQTYVEEQNWTVSGLLEHIINEHNSQVEPHKQFVIGDITVEDPNDNLYCGIQRESTWKTLADKLTSVLGGEFRLRVEEGISYIDYLKQIGQTRATSIELSKNMKSISREQDPSAIITRLIPLGNKLKVEETTTDEEGNVSTTTVETEERLDITSVNNGLNYIEDEAAKEKYGIRVGIVMYDDVSEASNLLNKGQDYLTNNNKVQIKYSITALDLSLLGLDIDDFDVCNYHPIKNALIGIDDVARIIKKTINVCEEVQSTIEVGDNFKTLTDIQLEQNGKIDNAFNTVTEIKKDYVTNEKLTQESQLITSIINQTAENIILSIEETQVTESDLEEIREMVSAELSVLSDNLNVTVTNMTEIINNMNGEMQTQFNTLSKYFTFDINGLKIGSTYTDDEGVEHISPFSVVIDNDEFIMKYLDDEIIRLDSEGQSHIPNLKITEELNLFGYKISEDNGKVNLEYVGGGS